VALAAELAGIDGFGAKIWTFDAFWWDAGALLSGMRDRFGASEPWPATWRARLSPEEVRALSDQNPVRFERHNEKVERLRLLLKLAREVEITVYEWGSD